MLQLRRQTWFHSGNWAHLLFLITHAHRLLCPPIHLPPCGTRLPLRAHSTPTPTLHNLPRLQQLPKAELPQISTSPVNLVLCHSRDVHPTWVKVTSPTDKTLRWVTWVLSAKSNKDLGSS